MSTRVQWELSQCMQQRGHSLADMLEWEEGASVPAALSAYLGKYDPCSRHVGTVGCASRSGRGLSAQNPFRLGMKLMTLVDEREVFTRARKISAVGNACY